MYVVALTRWAGSGAAAPSSAALEAEVAAFAPLLGLGAYELRLLLAGPTPVVLLEAPELERARQVLAAVRSRAHGAVACDLASVTPSEKMALPKTFRFEPDAFVTEAPGATPVRLPFADILALLPASHHLTAELITERSEKKLSLGRAALTGGLVVSKSRTVSEREVSHERERVLYVMNKSGTGHVLLRERRLHFTGLGERIRPSAVENLATTLGLLRERAPAARFDDRLLKLRRAPGSFQVSGTSASRKVTESNEGELDLAAHLLAVALLQGQA